MKELHPDTERLETVSGVINSAVNFILTCHIRPDADAIGSMLALGLAMTDAGKEATFYMEDHVPDVFKFLPGTEKIVYELPEYPDKTPVIILDCNTFQRTGKKNQDIFINAPFAVFLDHHLVDDRLFGLDETTAMNPKIYSYTDPEAFATGAIVFWLLEELDWPITKEIAINLYAAIASDTGNFRYSNTNITTFQMAEDLMRHGADPYAISNALYESYPLRRQKLLALALKTLEVKMNGRVAIMHVTPEMFHQSGADKEDSKDFISFARCIDTVEVAVFIKEFRSGQVNVSLRSKSFYNVADTAKQFGGGGHFHASGFRKTGSVFEIREELLKIFTESLAFEEKGLINE